MDIKIKTMFPSLYISEYLIKIRFNLIIDDEEYSIRIEHNKSGDLTLVLSSLITNILSQRAYKKKHFLFGKRFLESYMENIDDIEIFFNEGLYITIRGIIDMKVIRELNDIMIKKICEEINYVVKKYPYYWITNEIIHDVNIIYE